MNGEIVLFGSGVQLEAEAQDGVLRGMVPIIEVDAITVNNTQYTQEFWSGIKQQIDSLAESTNPAQTKVLTMYPGHFPFTSPETANPVLNIAGKIIGTHEEPGLEGGSTVGFIKFEVPDTTVGKDIQKLLKGGFIDGVSLRAVKPIFETISHPQRGTVKRVKGAVLLGADWCNDKSMRYSQGNLNQAQVRLLESINRPVGKEMVMTLDVAQVNSLSDLRAAHPGLASRLLEEAKTEVGQAADIQGVKEAAAKVPGLEKKLADAKTALEEAQGKVTQLEEVQGQLKTVTEELEGLKTSTQERDGKLLSFEKAARQQSLLEKVMAAVRKLVGDDQPKEVAAALAEQAKSELPGILGLVVTTETKDGKEVLLETPRGLSDDEVIAEVTSRAKGYLDVSKQLRLGQTINPDSAGRLLEEQKTETDGTPAHEGGEEPSGDEKSNVDKLHEAVEAKRS